MKKSALHFRVAAWSIKHPGQTYAAIGAAVILMVMLCVLLTSWAVRKPSQARPAQTIAAIQTPASFQKAGWVITSRQMIGQKQCIMYQRPSNGTRLTSCYVRQGEGWVFEQSF